MKSPKWSEQKRAKGPSKLGYEGVPKFSLEERENRWEALRQKMYCNKLDVLLLYGTDAGLGRGMTSFRYVTQCADAHGGWAIFPVKGDVTVLMGPEHMHLPYMPWHAMQSWVTDISNNLSPARLAEELKNRGYEKARIGVVSCESTQVSGDPLPYATYTNLKKAMPDAEFVDANGLILEMRMFKSREEIGMLREAGKIAGKKVQAMIDSLKVGNTEADMFAKMIEADLRGGAEICPFLLLNTGNVLEDDPGYKYLLHGAMAAASPVTRPFRDGDIALCEFHTRYGGYMAGVEFTCFLGDPPKPLVTLHETAMEIIGNVEKTLKPGVTCGQIWDVMNEPVARRNLDYMELGFHGHGMGSPEIPYGAYNILDDPGMTVVKDWRFRPGQVICLNIDIHDPAWRIDVGVMFGIMLLVTENGCEILADIPREFAVNKA